MNSNNNNVDNKLFALEYYSNTKNEPSRKVIDNKPFCIDITDMASYDTVYDNIPFKIVSVSYVRDMNRKFKAFKASMRAEINSWTKDTILGIFPEYCWRKTRPEKVFKFIHQLKGEIPRELTLVLGTLEFTLNGKFTSNAIVLHDKNLWYVPKTKVLKFEKNNGVELGRNPGIISLPRFKLGVLICADLWENSLLNKMSRNVDIVAIPAWLAAQHPITARKEFYALAKTRSLEFSVVIAVADHIDNVANATVIFSPADRSKDCPHKLLEETKKINLKAQENIANLIVKKENLEGNNIREEIERINSSKESYISNIKVERDIIEINLYDIHNARKNWDEKGLGLLL